MLLRIFAFILIIKVTLVAQPDPLNWTEPIHIEANDIFLIWQESGDAVQTFQKIYNFKTGSPLSVGGRDTLVQAYDRHQDERNALARFTDAANGKFNRDQYDDAVSIWMVDSGISVMLPQFDTTAARWTQSIQDNIYGDIQDDRIYVRTGNFDSDSLDEYIVAYLDSANSIHFKLYDVSSDLQPTLVAHISEDTVLAKPASIQFVRYFIECGDLNADGTDELVLFSVKQSWSSTQIPVTVKVYDFSEEPFEGKAETVFPVYKLISGTVLQDFLMAATIGNFITDEKDEIVFVANRKTPNPGRFAYSHVIEVVDNLDSIIVGTGHLMSQTGNNFSELSLASGDLNNDNRDEAVFVSSNEYRILATSDDRTNTTTLTAGVQNGGSGDYTQSYNYVEVADMDQDGREDIIIVKNFVGSTHDGFFVALISANDNLDEINVFARILSDEAQTDSYHPYAITVGNFDGYNFRVEQPIHTIVQDAIQPIVVLKAPPIHFDKFGENIFDVNECYNGGECDSYSKYSKELGTGVEVTTRVHNDFNFSAGYAVKGAVEVAPMGVGVSSEYEVSILGTAGLDFKSDTTNNEKVIIGVEVVARKDDRIYATISSYDVWEYPIYHGNEIRPRRSYTMIAPKSVVGTWFSSKSYNALSYTPNNEVGNILSYQNFDSLQHNPDLDQAIWDTGSSLSTFSMDESTDDYWYLRNSNFTQSSASRERELGIDVTIALGGFRSDFDYTNTKLNTHKNEINENIALDVRLGAIDLGIGDVKYSVTPYAYFGNNGAMIIDYAVEPEIAADGFPDTWWQQRYSDLSDPTFVLPWKLDPEKGFTLSEDAKRYQTKDIILSPQNPEPGDTITTIVKVRNFSLLQTPAPVAIQFYVGDPDSGGMELLGINGLNNAVTDNAIPARSTSDVEFKWVLREETHSFPRIYAVIDQENAIAEIHENNNKGFNVLGASQITTNITNINIYAPDKHKLYQSYPNPFNPLTNIKYTLAKQGKVSLKVYDILGREVITLVDKIQSSGNYTYAFNASRYASGVYFYKLEVNKQIVETKRMVLIK